MKLNVSLLLAPLIFSVGPALAQDTGLTEEQQEVIRQIALDINDSCTLPAQPPIPDGSTASRDDMLSGQSALQEYINAGNDYLGCLETLEESWGEDITDNQAAVVTSLYNRTVSTLQSSAEDFNTQLRAYQDSNQD